MSDTLSDITAESSRCLQCKNPSCRKGCPVSYDIPSFLSQVNAGNFDAAVSAVGHLFGEICGYICPHDLQCRGNCILNKKNLPVDVGMVERFAFGRYFPVIDRQSDSLSRLKIAVVGGGVSGLTFAVECYRSGADVTVFERAELLRTLKSIPYFRLPRQSIQKIENAVENSGIRVNYRNVTHDDLQNFLKNYDVVYLATGISVPRSLNVTGEEYAVSADEFLRGESFCDAIVVGGGNTAIDAARLNAAHGHKTVVAYRRTRADMPAFDREIAAAEAENVKFMFNLAPICVRKEKGLFVTFAKTASEGRGKLVLTSDTVTLECGILVTALGGGYDNSLWASERFVATDRDNNVCYNLYAGGDATGKNLAAQAVADGLNAARAVRRKYGA